MISSSTWVGRVANALSADLPVIHSLTMSFGSATQGWHCPRLTAVFRWACGRHSAHPRLVSVNQQRAGLVAGGQVKLGSTLIE